MLKTSLNLLKNNLNNLCLRSFSSEIYNPPPYTNHDILPAPFVIKSTIDRQLENASDLSYKVGERESSTKFVEKIVTTYRNRKIASLYDEDVSKRMFSNSCGGKPPKYREPCKTICDDDEDKDEFKRPEKEETDKCTKACQEWKKKRGVYVPKSICSDLKCLRQQSCGLEKTKVDPSCPIPKKKDCTFKIEPPPCPKAPPPYRYKNLDPNSYLDLPLCAPKKCPGKACGLLPTFVEGFKESGCSITPKLKKKGEKEEKEKKKCPQPKNPKCSSTRCIPVTIKTNCNDKEK